MCFMLCVSACLIVLLNMKQVLVIAHRLETVLMAKRIFHLEGGKLDELTHSTLLSGRSTGLVIWWLVWEIDKQGRCIPLPLITYWFWWSWLRYHKFVVWLMNWMDVLFLYSKEHIFFKFSKNHIYTVF